MPEELEDPRSERPDIEKYLGVIRRRHLQFLIPLFLGWLIVWGASWVLPPRYKSGTLILVEQPSMPQSYVLPNVSDDLQARLQSISQQILSRTRLLMIINKLNLYGGTQSRSTPDEKVDRMRKDIDVELVRDPQRDDISAFKISYTANNPHVAQQVTTELTSLFINENSRVREQLSEATTNFIEEQLDDAGSSLSAQLSKVQQFEALHEGTLPQQQASNLQILAGLQTQLQNEQDALNTANQQRTYLQAMLEQERIRTVKSPETGKNDVGTPGPNDLVTIDDQIAKLKTQLADLSSRYTDQYPDVQSTKSQIAKLEGIRDSLIAARVKGGNGNGGTGADSGLSAPAQQLESSLRANTLEIKNRESAINDLKARINEYQARLNAEPATEQQLNELNRNYDQSKANYDDLLKKRDQSAMATSMEQMQQGERFRTIDPPSLPAKPDFPNRLKFCGLGLGVGVAFGLVVAGIFEFMDDRVHSGKEIKAMLSMAVISEVPEFVTAAEQRNSKKRLILAWLTTAIVAVTILAGSVFSFLHS